MAARIPPLDGCDMSLCLISAGVTKTLALAAFTPAWTHSIEKTGWQEDWRVTPRGLELVEARVKGSGAGMEPPPEARLRDGWFEWRPQRAPMPQLLLGNSGVAGCARTERVVPCLKSWAIPREFTSRRCAHVSNPHPEPPMRIVFLPA
ncbi:MAG: hypothetical protein NTAFB05_22470 [Nitrobacter sp.]